VRRGVYLSLKHTPTLACWVSVCVYGRAAVTAVAYAAEGGLLVSGSADGTVSVWDVHYAQQLRTYTHHKGTAHICVNPTYMHLCLTPFGCRQGRWWGCG
jgi:WD40 repeat protein